MPDEHGNETREEALERIEAAEEANETGEEPVDTEAASDDSSDATDLTAEEKVKRIEAAGSPEEVDALAEGDERKTVQRAAEKKRSSWG
jgi:cell pole-organizing protein PopZ